MRVALIVLLCSASALAAVDLTGPSQRLLERAKSLYASADYTEVLQLGRELERRADLTLEQRLEAYRLLGSALAIVEDPLDAEPVARRLFNLQPDYQLPPGTPAKILNVFQKVRREVKEAIEQAERLKRESQISKMKVLDPLPAEATGGQPLAFSFRLLDADSLVGQVEVHYRRHGQTAYSSLALGRDPTGQWSGKIPAEVTADPTGFVLEHFVETTDEKGPLLRVGSEQHPLALSVTAGSVPKVRLKRPLSRAPFLVALSGTFAAGVAATAFGIEKVVTQSEHNALTTSTGSAFEALNRRGALFADATTGALIGLGAFALTSVILFFLTEWEP